MYVNECIWSIFWHIWKPSGGQTGNRFQLEWLLRHFNTKPGQTHGLWVFFPQWFGAHSWVLAVECGSSQSRWFLDRTTDALGFKHEIHGTQMSLSPDPIPIVAGQSSVPNVGVFSNQWGHSWVTKWLMSIDAIHACLCCLSFTFWKRPKISQFRCLLYHQKKVWFLISARWQNHGLFEIIFSVMVITSTQSSSLVDSFTTVEALQV
jgi:hypothetical protein